MLRIGVMVSGGGTNLQAIMDAMDSGRITNTELAVVISNNANAYALERARLRGIEQCAFHPGNMRQGMRLMRPFWQRWTDISWI